MKEVPENMLSQLADGGWPQPIVDMVRWYAF